jgi:hypothetical protein
MAEMLLINPRSRTRKARKATAKRRVHRRRSVSAVSHTTRHVRRRRHNPIGLARVHHRARRRHHVARRRRNPIHLRGLSSNSIMQMLKEAMIGGAGAIGVDVLMGYIKGYLPTALQRTPGKLTAGDAVKAGITVALGQLLSKPTRGLSRKLAAGALTVQARDILASFVPTSMTLGYASPARIVSGTNRVDPIARGNVAQMGAYQRANSRSPLLGAYQRANGPTPMLNGTYGGSTRAREGVMYK